MSNSPLDQFIANIPAQDADDWDDERFRAAAVAEDGRPIAAGGPPWRSVEELKDAATLNRVTRDASGSSAEGLMSYRLASQTCGGNL